MGLLILVQEHHRCLISYDQQHDLGRALQGAGAVGSTIMAMLADLTRKINAQAMAMAGMTIGASFISYAARPTVKCMDNTNGIFG